MCRLERQSETTRDEKNNGGSRMRIKGFSRIVQIVASSEENRRQMPYESRTLKRRCKRRLLPEQRLHSIPTSLFVFFSAVWPRGNSGFCISRRRHRLARHYSREIRSIRFLCPLKFSIEIQLVPLFRLSSFILSNVCSSIENFELTVIDKFARTVRLV